ncbi:MAG: DUF364 domain-containing protein [Gammaproteobacteria bacterium]|nr:DUF364 domain-containing protein [Gammaproteobacteria bacterium]
MTIAAEYLQMIGEVANRFPVPAVSDIIIPRSLSQEKQADFGLLTLEDGACGLFYCMLDTSREDFYEQFDLDRFRGKSPVQIAQLYAGDSEAGRSIGLAAINAITQFVYHACDYKPDTATDSLGELDLSPGDHLGMVGFFKPLMDRLEGSGIEITVLEKKTGIQDVPGFARLSHDPVSLGDCNKVLCTASTLLNNSLPDILDNTRAADAMILIGPTAGCFPDPLFRCGVTAIGGSLIVNPSVARKRLASDQGLGDAAEKFLIRRSTYPGFSSIAGTEQD